MTRSVKADRIRAILDELYPEVAIPLAHTDPFTLLVAVVLSAQTTDAMVNRVTPTLFEAAPNARALAAMHPSEIQRHIRMCGLAPGKARRLQSMAEHLVTHYDGVVPASLLALEALPGVGHKTASVVLAQAFGHATLPVDTHIHRLAARWGLSNGSRVDRTEQDLKRVFPRAHWSKLHLQMIYFGREHCPARNHNMTTCPICSWAASRKAIREHSRPVEVD